MHLCERFEFDRFSSLFVIIMKMTGKRKFLFQKIVTVFKNNLILCGNVW